MASGPLSRIRVRNYQSLRKLDIQLGKITAIVGKTDSGKSALFRAVKGVVGNEAGKEFITAGEDRAVVAIDNVAWIQSVKDNGYQIGSLKWDKVGRGVPDEVRTELNMGEFEFGKDVKLFLNFSGQLGNAFLVQGNPADNAKVVGSISNIHIIYNALREAEKDTKATKRKISTVQEQADQYGEQLIKDEKELKNLDKLYGTLKDVFSKAKALDETLTKLVRIRDRLIVVKREEQETRARLAQFASVDISAYDEALTLIERGMALQGKSESLRGQIRAVRLRKKRLEAISLEKGADTLAEYESLLKLKSQGLTIKKKADSIGRAIEATERELAIFTGDVDGMEWDMAQLGVCDVCGAEKEHWKIGVKS